MTARRIRHVDAFTSTPLEGNPAAVVDGEGLSAELMQRIARNQKLSETVFLLRPADTSNHARLRIFTPAVELPFAGHPTIAAAHTLVSERIVSLREQEALRLETGAGVIPVEVSSDDAAPVYTMTQPAPQFRDSDVSPDEIARRIGLTPRDILRVEYVSTGIWWLVAQLASLDAMLRVQPDMSALASNVMSIFCLGAQSPDAGARVRTFAPAYGVPEDPVTGSSNGCIAALVAKHALLPADGGEIRYVVEQGIEMGQPGRVYLRATGMPDDIRVQVGGHAVTALVGDLLLPD